MAPSNTHLTKPLWPAVGCPNSALMVSAPAQSKDRLRRQMSSWRARSLLVCKHSAGIRYPYLKIITYFMCDDCDDMWLHDVSMMFHDSPPFRSSAKSLA